jgi:Replication-relaxation
VYTLGAKGRDFLANELGLPVDWYFRPEKVRHFSYSHILHSLILTRFLITAEIWSRKQTGFRLAQKRISYELAQRPARVEVGDGRINEVLKVIPDAWLLFEELENGSHARWYPVLLEIDRGTEYQQKFKQHVRS